ncbi:hypothetical protein A3H55_01970 [Candidatus Kuenenbacteria bacterium RIFCSPLOWO2_02_FULL_42_16]|uniref:Cell division protein FtsQ/DivIB C-terminal domain-containing protein n=1 Tax=Candidatus Kuenenbacteria bacterium RIFCSPLOWO2_02_FULL_42_16 TaxID=1798564 RepID=A0A1F6FYP5_9BACT|nr:MAG: hypothetical protein A3H55_01970 [Candidatus Kuenenbacteria bacterium RIFCSPLOWO2_02_FULL_42_16]
MDRKFFKNKEQLEVLASRVSSGRLERGARKKKVILATMIILIIISGLIYALIYSPIFKIEKITVEGVNGVDVLNQIQIAANKYTSGYKLLFLPRDNLLFLDKEGLIRFLSENTPVEEIKVGKKLFETLVISGQEKLPVLLWQEGQQNYYIDKTGLVMAAVNKENIKYSLTTINRGTTTPVVVGRKIIDERNVGFIQEALDQIQQQLRDYPVVRVEANDFSNNEIKFYAAEGWYFVLNTRLALDKPLDNLVEFLKQKESEILQLKYIDLRVEDKIFYK